MSFPRLRLTGGTGEDALKYITDIALYYDNDGTVTKPELMMRSRYDVKRETTLANVQSATPNRFPDIKYDLCRLIHTWTGYADVLTESVCVTATSDADTLETVALLKTAKVLDMRGPEFTITGFDPSELGPDQPNINGIYDTAWEQGVTSTIGYTKDGNDYTPITSTKWTIKSTTISDNNNNTSRVTFVFEIAEPWENLASLLV